MKTGLVNGCFDLLHEGHKLMLSEALANCDHLTVALNSDASVTRLKGPMRPIQNWENRFWAIERWYEGLSWVKPRWDLLTPIAVIPFEGDDQKLLLQIRPQILFKGYDHGALPIFYRRIGWKHLPVGEPVFEGPEIHQCGRIEGVSTTKLLEQMQHESA